MSERPKTVREEIRSYYNSSIKEHNERFFPEAEKLQNLRDREAASVMKYGYRNKFGDRISDVINGVGKIVKTYRDNFPKAEKIDVPVYANGPSTLHRDRVGGRNPGTPKITQPSSPISPINKPDVTYSIGPGVIPSERLGKGSASPYSEGPKSGINERSNKPSSGTVNETPSGIMNPEVTYSFTNLPEERLGPSSETPRSAIHKDTVGASRDAAKKPNYFDRVLNKFSSNFRGAMGDLNEQLNSDESFSPYKGRNIILNAFRDTGTYMKNDSDKRMGTYKANLNSGIEDTANDVGNRVGKAGESLGDIVRYTGRVLSLFGKRGQERARKSDNVGDYIEFGLGDLGDKIKNAGKLGRHALTDRKSNYLGTNPKTIYVGENGEVDSESRFPLNPVTKLVRKERVYLVNNSDKVYSVKTKGAKAKPTRGFQDVNPNEVDRDIEDLKSQVSSYGNDLNHEAKNLVKTIKRAKYIDETTRKDLLDRATNVSTALNSDKNLPQDEKMLGKYEISGTEIDSMHEEIAGYREKRAGWKNQARTANKGYESDVNAFFDGMENASPGGGFMEPTEKNSYVKTDATESGEAARIVNDALKMGGRKLTKYDRIAAQNKEILSKYGDITKPVDMSNMPKGALNDYINNKNGYHPIKGSMDAISKYMKLGKDAIYNGATKLKNKFSDIKFNHDVNKLDRVHNKQMKQLDGISSEINEYKSALKEINNDIKSYK